MRRSWSFPIAVASLVFGIILVLEADIFLPASLRFEGSKPSFNHVLPGARPEFIYRKKISHLQRVEDFIIRRPAKHQGVGKPDRLSHLKEEEGRQTIPEDTDVDGEDRGSKNWNDVEGKFASSEAQRENEDDINRARENTGKIRKDDIETFQPRLTPEFPAEKNVDQETDMAIEEAPSGKQEAFLVKDGGGSAQEGNGDSVAREEENIAADGNSDSEIPDGDNITADDNSDSQTPEGETDQNVQTEDRSSSNTDLSSKVDEGEPEGDDSSSSFEESNKIEEEKNSAKKDKKKNKDRIDNSIIAARHKGDVTSYIMETGKQRSKLHNKIVRRFTLKKEEARHNLINRHKYEYVLDSSACDTGSPKFVILVHSKFNNFIKRSKIRNTYAKNNTANGVEFAVTFILGQPNIDEVGAGPFTARRANDWRKRKTTRADRLRKLNDTMAALKVESNVFKDIVMGNFVDSYRNLTIKHILAYDWALKRCPKDLAFILKVDDDILVNTYSVARLFKQTSLADRQGLLVCDVPEGHKVIRGSHNKWFVSKEEYPFRFYPPWCKGYGVFMTRDVVRKLYDASADMRYFWIDDVYVTGLLAWRAGVHVRNFRQKQATVTHNKFRYRDVYAFFVWAPFNKKHSHRQYWTEMVAAQAKH